LTYRVNIFELARAIETLTGSPAGTYLKQEWNNYEYWND
jgi:hypothetical protein